MIWSNSSYEETLSNSSKIPDNGNSFVNLLQKNFVPFSVAQANKQQELIIQSDKQSEINDVIYAEGNVSVSYGDKLLRADYLIYDKSSISVLVFINPSTSNKYPFSLIKLYSSCLALKN